MTKTFRIIPTPPVAADSPNYKHYADHHIRYPFTVVDEVGRKFGDYPSETAAAGRVAYLEWEYSLPVGRRHNTLLVDVRAVRSKAATTLEYAADGKNDEERAAMVADLKKVVEILDRWQRTGPRPKTPAGLDRGPY